MPIFLYECLTCGRQEDILVKHSEAEAMQFCTCRKELSMRKIDTISASLIKFKGNWHKTTGTY